MPNQAPAGYVTPTSPEAPGSQPMSSEQLAAVRAQFIEMISRAIMTVIQGFFNPLGGSGLFQFGNFLNGFLGTDFLTGEWQSLIDRFFNVASGSSSGLNIPFLDMLNVLPNLLNRGSRLQSQVGALPGGAVSGTSPNMVIEGAFRDLITLTPGQGWFWDNTEGRTIPGTAKVVADGAQNELVSNHFPVSAGQKINLSAYVKWNSLSYTGSNPISLGVTGYDYDDLTKQYSEQTSTDVVNLATPAASGGWQQLSGTFTVPSTSTPDVLRLRLKIGGNLTVGNVWWDEASATHADLVRDDVVPGLPAILQNAFNALENLADGAVDPSESLFGDWSHTNFFNALFGQNQSTIGLNTRVTYLESLQTAGIKVTDDFERTSSANLGANWAQTYIGGGAGTWATSNGHDAGWIDSGTGDREVFCRYIGTGATSNTDNQKIIAVLGSKAEDITQDNPDAHGSNYLLGRLSADSQNYIQANFYSHGLITIVRCLAGVTTTLASVTQSTGPSAGSTIGLLCGTAGGTRFFEAQINGQTVLNANDATSAIGAGNRGWGHGARAEGYSYVSIWPPFFFSGQASPGRYNSWAAIDN